MLHSLENSISKSIEYEIIFVDDFSTDATRSWLQGLGDPKISVTLNPSNYGYAKSNNIGATKAKGELLCLLNNDLLFEEGWLEPMIEILQDANLNAAIVGNVQFRVADGKLDHAGMHITPIAKLEHVRKFPVKKVSYANSFVVTGACMLMRKDDFDEVGGFDENYINGCEDVDLCLKMRKMLGKEILVSLKSRIKHHISLSRDIVSLTNLHNSRYLFAKWHDEIKDELVRLWLDILQKSPQKYKNYIGGELRQSFLSDTQKAANTIAQTMFLREQYSSLHLLDEKDPNNSIANFVLLEGACYDATLGGYILTSKSSIVLKNCKYIRDFYICGYSTNNFEQNKAMIKLCFNNILTKEFHLDKTNNFNIGITNPIMLNKEDNFATIQAHYDKNPQKSLTCFDNEKIVITHLVVDDKKIEDIKMIDAELRDDFFFLNNLIRTLRPDLCKMFPLKSKKDKQKWFSWLITNGTKEYKSLTENRDLPKLLNTKDPSTSLTILQEIILSLRPDLQAAFSLPNDLLAFLQWFYTHGVEEHDIYRWLSNAQKEIVLSQPEPWQQRLKPFIQDDNEKPIKSLKDREFGVNIIGYAFGQLGIGEDARMAARAIRDISLPFSMIDFPPGADIPQNDKTMQEYVKDEGEYAFNIFCMTALENARFYAEKGSSQFKGRYNIGYWPWELSRWPKEWKGLSRLVDEIWVSTKHTYDSVVKNSSVPVYIMPMAVELGPISGKNRKDFGLPKSTKLFCFSFDLNSSIHRKNPQACVDSFLRAFPKQNNDDVGLVVKVHPPKDRNKEWEKLKKLASQESRIYIIESTLSREDLLALYSCCDCFLSLHRAEGFGRGIAEALQLGLHVITTGYSGNVDFCKGENVDLVNYKLIEVKKEHYPFAEGQVWADADVKHAAYLMRRFVDSNKKKNGILDFEEFSTNYIGNKYKERLIQIRRSWK